MSNIHMKGRSYYARTKSHPRYRGLRDKRCALPQCSGFPNQEETPRRREAVQSRRFIQDFGDTTRVRILYALFESELCVCAISELLSMTQSATSHQLKVLKDSKLVGSRREGKTIYYFLADNHVSSIIDQGFEHITEGNDENNG